MSRQKQTNDMLSTAIALNNIGVTLLERRSYDGAFSCFKNSLSILRPYSMLNTVIADHDDSRGRKTESQPQGHHHHLGNEYLQASSLLLAQTSKSSLSSRTTMMMANAMQFQVRVVCTDTYRSRDDIMIAASESTNNWSGYALRIDDRDEQLFATNEETNNASSNPQWVTAIALFNMGTACRGCEMELVLLNDMNTKKEKHSATKVTTTTTTNNSNKVSLLTTTRCKARNLFHAAFRTFTAIMRLETDACRARSQGFLTMLILQNMIHLEVQANNRTVALEYYRKLGDLRTELVSIEIPMAHQELAQISTAGAA